MLRRKNKQSGYGISFRLIYTPIYYFFDLLGGGLQLFSGRGLGEAGVYQSFIGSGFFQNT